MLRSNWWIKPAWRLYAHLPPAADDVFNQCLRYVSPLRSLRLPITLLRGLSRCDGRPGTVVTAGAEQGIDYFTHRFFAGDPRREPVGEVPLWDLARTLNRLRTSADLTIARVDRLSAGFLFDASYLAVPEWVGSTLTVPEDHAGLTRGRRGLKSNLRTVHRNGLTSDLSQVESDLEVFYHTMYVPYIRNRHGEHAVIRSIDWLRRGFRRGGLLWVRRSGRPVAGQILQRRDQTLKFVVLGKSNEERAPVRAGTTDALYLSGIHYAKELGCTLVDFGSCRPSLNDGVLRYKRKWGANLVVQHRAHYDLLVHWGRLSEPVVAFLAHTPLIFRDRDGLSAVTAAAGRDEPVRRADAWKAHRSLWVPGLRRLYLVSTSGWRDGQESPPQTVLTDLKGTGACDPQTLQTLWGKGP